MVRRDKETDDDDTANVEEQDTDVNPLDRLGQVATRVLRFASGDLRRVREYSLLRSTGGGVPGARLTATISVPMKENAACVRTANQPRNWPFAPGILSYCTNGPGFFQ